MKFSTHARTWLATAALLAAGQAMAAPNLVVNGNFESGSGVGQIGAVATGTGWANPTVFNGFSNVTAFNFVFDTTADNGLFGTTGGAASENTPITFSNVFLWGADNGVANGFTASNNGGQFMGGSSTYAVGALTQTISGLTVGAQYDLNFEWAGAQLTDGTGNYYVGWEVSFGGESFSVGGASTGVAASMGFAPWTGASYTFTATSTTQTLGFLAQGGGGMNMPVSLLDGVSLTQVATATPVPEPESLALMLAGGALLVAKRRREIKRAA